MPDREPPYEEIADLLKQGQVIPLLGAGVNFGTRPPKQEYDEKESMFLPSGSELSRILARRCNFPSKDDHDLSDLAKVASYFQETTGRRNLRGRLRHVFNRNYKPCTIHTYLASVPSPLLIVTTNYDDLIERAFRDASKSYDLVVHPTDRKDVEGSVLWWRHGADQPKAVPPNRLHIKLEETTVIYKMHGTVDRLRDDGDSYVITEDDYVDFLSRMTGSNAVPAQFMKYFSNRHFLFLGYGLRDWNFRVVLKNLRSLSPPEKTGLEDVSPISWAIQHAPSGHEQELWQSRKVKIYNVDINEFVANLLGNFSGPEDQST